MLQMKMAVVAKLNLLFVASILFIAIYLVYIYKEVKIFDKEIIEMKLKLESIQLELNKVQEAKVCTNDVYIADEKHEEEDDKVSVSSGDIKNILTNIQEVDDEDPEEQTKEPELVQESDKECETYDDATLQVLKYEDIRAIVRKMGGNAKGTKQDLIQRILETQQ